MAADTAGTVDMGGTEGTADTAAMEDIMDTLVSEIILVNYYAIIDFSRSSRLISATYKHRIRLLGSIRNNI